MNIDYNKLFNPDNIEIKEDVSDIYTIIELEEVLFAISEKVIKYRKENNLTQKQLAEKLKVNQTMISKLERGDYNPTFKQIYNMSRKLTNSSDLFVDILKNIEEKIKKISTHNYKIEIDSEKIVNGYCVSKSKNTKIINIKYNGVVGGNIKYGECTSSISNVG